MAWAIKWNYCYRLVYSELKIVRFNIYIFKLWIIYREPSTIDECFKRKSILYSEVNVQSFISNVETSSVETPRTAQRFELKETNIVPRKWSLGNLVQNQFQMI